MLEFINNKTRHMKFTIKSYHVVMVCGFLAALLMTLTQQSNPPTTEKAVAVVEVAPSDAPSPPPPPPSQVVVAEPPTCSTEHISFYAMGDSLKDAIVTYPMENATAEPDETFDPLVQKLMDKAYRQEALTDFEKAQIRTKRRLGHMRVDTSVQLNRTYVPKVWNLSPDEEVARGAILYIIVTGTNSIRNRVQGLHHTLGSARDVLWFTDQNVTHPNFDLIRPIVLRNDFEDEVCKQEGLVEETQMKGCRYQRSFYRHQAIWRWLRAHPEVWENRKWIVKSSDDTFILPHHLEHVLRTKYDPDIPWVLGQNISRATYWFFSGGHATVFSRAVMKLWTARIDECEGILIDYAPHKMRKFWWWADDVLMSYCWMHLGFRTAHLPGCFSAGKFGDLPRVTRMWACANYTPTVQSKEKSVWQELPLSLHTYPYISPEQMFDMWNTIYKT